MTRAVWLTDLHLNFVAHGQRQRFYARVANEKPDAVLLSGDIAESGDVCDYLRQISDAWSCPVYFVLGNHDFYFGSISGVREDVARLCKQRGNLHYLSLTAVHALNESVAIVGHDGWADARLGDYERSYIVMNDFRLIEEISGLDKRQRWPLLKSLGDQAAAHIRKVLPPALARFQDVVLLTHVPPMREACWHQGKISDDQWAPHFTCKAVGDAILEIMSHHPNHRLTVLCGHTHGSGTTCPTPNITIHTGGAEYGNPDIVKILELGGT